MKTMTLLALFAPALLARALPGYIGPAACATCHPEIAASYAQTGMARSFRAVRAGVDLPEFNAAPFRHETSRQTFTFTRDKRGYSVRREQLTGGFPPYVVGVDYVLGSGDHARSYLHLDTDKKLIEFPVTWYARDGGYWDMSPGYERAGHQGFTRRINYRCMFCHNAYPDIRGPDAESDTSSTFGTELPQGIDCERCHGPGERHAKDGQRASIVNPARLAPERAMEVCMQCHLETTSGQLPGAMMRTLREVFSYRPGAPLGDYQLYFDHAPEAGRGDKFEIVSSAYRLRQSACFQADPAKLACTVCHDVHRASTRVETLARTVRLCVGCHQNVTHGADRGCVDCHMPQREPEDAPHIVITDHRISRIAPPAKARPLPELPYAGPLVLYYPESLRESPEAARYIADARAHNTARTGAGADEYTAKGQALLKAGDVSGAVAAFREAVNKRPEIADIRVNLAAALIAERRYDAAREQLNEAIRTGPSIEAALFEWVEAIRSGANPRNAADRYRASLKAQMLSAHSNLGTVLALLGDRQAAIAEFRLAVECDPSSAAARENLRLALGNR